jgi:serine/threonine-protein kinase
MVQCILGVFRLPVSEHVLRAFRRSDPSNRDPVVDAVQRAGFTVENIQEDFRNPEKWGLFLKPSRGLADLFRLDREVLLWATIYPRFQARDIENIKSLIEERGVRLTRNFAILVSKYDPDSRSRTEAESALDTTIVHCSIEELARRSDTTQEPVLRRLLLNRLYTRDLYDLRVATTRSADFFGRRSTVDDLADEVVSGNSQIGVFGLRKIGKTSLVNRVTDIVAQSGKCIVSKVDLQWTTSVDPRPEYTLWSIGETLYASSRLVRNVKGLKLFGQFSTSSDAEASGLSVWEAFNHDLVALLRSNNRRILFAIDEIERLFELPDKVSFVRLWRFLRGCDQQFSSRLRFLISGTSPECAECSSIEGQDNPLYRYLSVRYLGRLGPADSRELLVALGGPIGLLWDTPALTYAFQQTGGHPALLRSMGSTVHALASPRVAPKVVDRETAVSAAKHLLATNPSDLAHVTAALEDQYPDEFLMLTMLTSGQIFGFKELASSYPAELSHLIGYGLLPNGTESDRISIGLLQAYLQARASHAGMNSKPTAMISIGERIGQLRIISRLKSAGFADVFLAEDEAGARSAVKVFRGARLSALEREVDYLQSLDHPGIVRFLEATQTLGGLPCLVTEYLEGNTLAERCNATSAPETAELVSIASSILEALAYMHPDTKSAAKIRGKDELTIQEFENWERLRQGIVHRDIKPENVILTKRGPVLIDFNISIRAATPVTTMSLTPGYLPPDFNGISWTPDVDIYQLGVTLAQLAAGAMFDGENLPDLLSMARSRHGDGISNWLDSLVADGRPDNASELLRQLRSVSPARRTQG